MRGLVLKDEEVRALMRDGVVVVRRVVKCEYTLAATEAGCDPIYDNKGARIGKDTIGRKIIGHMCSINEGPSLEDCIRMFCPIGQPGERRFVKEAWVPGYYHEAEHEDGPKISVIYRVDNTEAIISAPSYEMAAQWERDFSDDGDEPPKYRSAMHMTRELSRTTTECTTATAEQVDGVWWWSATHKRITE